MSNDLAHGSLSIFDDRPEGRIVFLHLDTNGIVTVRNGHVDLGTGVETALAQIVSEELDIALDRVFVVLGDTDSTPDQGPTIASETIQITAAPLRSAAAQARLAILGLAERRFNTPACDLLSKDGTVFGPDAAYGYGALLADHELVMRLDPEVPVKDPALYRIVGQPVRRRDLPAKVTGDFIYIHDLRLPDMLHGHVIRPPYAGRDSGDFVGRSLISVDKTSVAHMAGLIAIVQEGDFLGVVADDARRATDIANALKVTWRMPPDLPPLDHRLEQTIRDQPSTPRVVDATGDFESAFAECGTQLSRTYLWPYHLHGSIGPSCGVADWNGGAPLVWSGTQNPHMLRADLAVLCGLDAGEIEVRRLQAAGCYGRNCADDVCGDALLMSRATGRPVRVQLTREQENLWEPKGAAQLMQVQGGIGQDGDLGAYAIDSWYPSNRGPNLALLLTGRISPEPHHAMMGDRTIVPPYRVPHKRIICHDLAPIVRASWMRGVSALPNTFAHESFMDELANEAGEDPVDFRLRHLDDPRQADLIRRTAQAADWNTHAGPRFKKQGRMAYGQGFAYATYVHGAFPGTAAASAAWVCDVAVDTETGEVTLTRVFVGQDQGLVINPDGVRAQIHGNVMQTTSRVLSEEVTFDAIAPTPKSWANYPIQSFDRLPQIQTLLIERPGDPALGVGESAAVPAAAAIANAIFDATGIRLREAPFTPEKLRAALVGQGQGPTSLPAPKVTSRRRRIWAALASIGSALTFGALALPIHSAIPVSRAPLAAQFTAETLTRGAQVFATGNCAGCHTAPDGVPNAGGLEMQTPFGTVATTNLTPDPETGLGLWSFSAFERAMRHGISRDGSNLYPVFPYTSFARIDDGDMQALYAYLQTLPPVRSAPAGASMLAPLNLRPVNAAWNLMFHDPAPLPVDPAKSDLWNRGQYLVDGAGHCSACHTPRNALGAEQAKRALTGAMVGEAWAPALTGPDADARGWDEDSLFVYLRQGYAPDIAAAHGKMAQVVDSLRSVPDSDIRAMATYIASGITPTPVIRSKAMPQPGPASRIYQSTCAGCHTPGLPGAETAARIPLTMSAAIRAPQSDALLSVIRNGVEAPLTLPLRDMPAFDDQLSSEQMDALANYLRERFAPDLPAWGR
ncbi:molybdopterin cofactor-binding domain-containing protein [Paracoccus sp. JM45]|uniref:molybdopterin cofactor-binding domain-containing protein n=1 Tax=Paracoccus sp. JM45 TaxID=2283626 RepID=UPI000E6BB1F6|nr:molybdopterin cofactor-binding domain-containing protein [Paracoccus sp. JM45]RJE79670.1 aldehyde dehydrogenase [Paracoccus sp. JM45]